MTGSIDEGLDMSGIMAAYESSTGGSDPNEQQPPQNTGNEPPAPNGDEGGEGQSAPAAGGSANPQQTQQQPQNQTPEEVFGTGKANVAFARMRTENKAMQQALTRLGGMLGVDTKDPNALVDAITEKMQEYESKQSQIPVALLQRLEAAEKYMAAQDEQRIGDAARIGFQKVKDTYKLTDAQLTNFAVKLRDAGKNPFTQAVDLMQEYKLMYFDEILQKAKDEAAAAATQRKQKAKEHSTAPGSAQGSVGGGTSSTGSVSDLAQLLSKNNF